MAFSNTYGRGGDMREISSHTRRVDHIIEGEFVDERTGFQE